MLRGKLTAGLAVIAALVAGSAFGSSSAAAAANDGYKVPSRSGGAWASGAFVLGWDTPRYAEFANYRQRPLDVVSTFPSRATWDDFIEPGPAYSTFTGQPYTMVYGIPPIPEEEDASLDQCAAGDYNDKWTTFGHTMTDAGLGSSIIRLGWEMNGRWFRWGADADAVAYAECFRQVVTTVRAVAPNLKFDWNVNRGASNGISDTEELQNVAYPGDAYVDIIGVDTYDSWVDWNWALNDPEQGMNAWLAFAREHGKKLSFPEWGLYTTTFENGDPAPGHGDQPDYIQHMYDFFRVNAADIAYEAYFSNDNNDGRNSLWNPVQMPLASAKYKQLYKTTTTPPGVTSIQDTARGTGVGQVQFSANWGQCTGTTCAKVSDRSYVWTATPGSTATVRFTGSRFRWFGMREPFSVIATVAIDGGTPVDVDPYVPNASVGSDQLYVSPVLAEGTHTVVITMTDRRNEDSQGGSSITFDRIDVASGLRTIQDTARGSGPGQVQFSANWGLCTTTCGKVSDRSYVWTATPGSTATVRFTGSRFRWFGMREPFSVIATVAIDGGTPVDVDPYLANAGISSEQLYVSPVLAEGTHTAVITMTNRRNGASTGGSSITFDHADVN